MQVVKEPACTFAIASIATKKMRFVAVPTTAQMAAHGRMDLMPFSGFALTTAQASRLPTPESTMSNAARNMPETLSNPIQEERPLSGCRDNLEENRRSFL